LNNPLNAPENYAPAKFVCQVCKNLFDTSLGLARHAGQVVCYDGYLNKEQQQKQQREKKRLRKEMKKTKKKKKKNQSTSQLLLNHPLTILMNKHINKLYANANIVDEETIKQQAESFVAASDILLANISRLVISVILVGAGQRTSNRSLKAAKSAAKMAGRNPGEVYVLKRITIVLKGEDHSMTRQEQGATCNADGTVTHHFVYTL
jgi:hypothetical protein